MTIATTLKLPETLKDQIAQLAQAAGKSPHAWMVEAIEAQASSAAKRQSFLAQAQQSLAEYERTGVYYKAGDVHRYFIARASGKKARRPKPFSR